MRIKRIWLGTLLLSAALGTACGGDSGPKPAPVGGNGGTKPGGGGSSDAEGGAPTEKDASDFPDDKTGPKVEFKQPMSGKTAIVGGTVVVIASITDEPAGIATGPNKLFGSIENSDGKPVVIEAIADKDTFKFAFDATDFDDRADLTLTIHAEDSVGNVTLAPVLMQLDTQAPWVSLDPPDLRLATLDKGVVTCSGNYDPLGASPKDGEVVLKEARIRAFLWDRAIQIPGATEVYYSGVNEKEVRLFFQGDAEKPLLTDGPDKDNICDTVSDDGKAVALDPIKSAGTPPPGEGTESADPDPSECGALTPMKATDVPKTLCATSEMYFVPTHEVPGGAPVVFGVSATGGSCTGTAFDSNTKGGWTCVVAQGWDRADPDEKGNQGFSKPIRVCRKLLKTDCEGADAGEILTPPKSLTCTDGCTLPPEVKEWGRPEITTKN